MTRADALVLFGATGDLARKKLFSALYQLEAQNRLNLAVIGVALSDWDDEQFRDHARSAIGATVKGADPVVVQRLCQRLTLVGGDYRQEETFQSLASRLRALGSRHGVFYLAIPTPLYHIASTFISPSTMMTSMQHAMTGSTFYFSFGPAVLGAMIHMMIGAMYGTMFAIAAVLLRLRGPVLIAAGAAWGAMVFVISSFIALPLAAALFSSGDQISHMASKVGYGTFLTEHVLFGLALGVLLASRRLFARQS